MCKQNHAPGILFWVVREFLRRSRYRTGLLLLSPNRIKIIDPTILFKLREGTMQKKV